jgi:hypothetical protein
MIHMTPEDLRSCGLAKKGDSWWQGPARVFGTYAKAAIAAANGGPKAAIRAGLKEANKYVANSDYRRSDFHYKSCKNPFCNGCKSYNGK